MPNGLNFLLGAVGQANQDRQQNTNLGQQLQQAIMLAQIKQKIAQQDPLSQLLKQGQVADAQMKIFQAGGPQPNLFGGQNQQAPQINPLVKKPNNTPNFNQQAVMGLSGNAGNAQGLPITQQNGGINDLRLNQTQSVPEFDQFGRVSKTRIESTPQAEILKKGLEKKFTDRVDAQGKSEAAQRMALQNLNLVTGSIRELSQTYADSVREGGMGNIFNQAYSKGSLFVGGGQGEKFSATDAYSGQKTEVVARLMPLLTQQGDSPGSVRLVQTVFDKLEVTLPKGNTPPKNARRMSEQTIRNTYRFARAAQELGLTNEFVEGKTDEELKSFSVKVANVARGIKLTREEENTLKSLIDNSLEPIDNLINDRSGGNGAEKKRLFDKYGLN